MTIGELRTLYVHNHVVNLKDRQGTTNQLQRYVGPFDALQLGELTKMQVVSWHQEIGRTRGARRRTKRCSSFARCTRGRKIGNCTMAETRRIASRSSQSGRGNALFKRTKCPGS